MILSFNANYVVLYSGEVMLTDDAKIRVLINLLQETSDRLYYVFRERNRFARALRECNHGEKGTCMCPTCMLAEELLDTANEED
jgi:hypothetical protein